VSILSILQPRFFVVTTPNNECNGPIKTVMQAYHCQDNEWEEGDEESLEVDDEGQGQKNASLSSSSSPAPYVPFPFRERDHKFEWSRDQFREWCEGVKIRVRMESGAGALEYRSVITELGHLSHIPTNCGGATQVCVFAKEGEQASTFCHTSNLPSFPPSFKKLWSMNQEGVVESSFKCSGLSGCVCDECCRKRLSAMK